MSWAKPKISSHFVLELITTSNPLSAGFSVEKNDNNISQDLLINNFLAENLSLARPSVLTLTNLLLIAKSKHSEKP